MYSYLTRCTFFMIIHSLKLQALMPDGYIGCFEDSPDRVLNGDRKDFDPNSAYRCKRYCQKKKYRYAGTESGEECFCGHFIREKQSSDGCNYKCEGNSAEICGGDWRISIYDTWLCTARPCKNGATCLNIDANNYKCSCTNGWIGENCEQEKPTTTSTTTTTTTVLKTTSPVYINSTESNIIVTNTATTTNTSEIQYKIPAVVSSNSMIAMYVLLPMSLCFILVIIALVLRRRYSHRFKKQPFQECINRVPGTIPDIIANVTTPQVNHSDRINESQNLSGDIAALAGDGNEYSVIRKERRRPEVLELEEYNIITLRPNNELLSDKCYDHVAIHTNTSDKTYSQLSASNFINEQDMLNNTYSRIEKYHAKNHTNGSAENRDNTYNTLLLEKIPRSEESCSGLEVNPEYDHTGSSIGGEDNDYTNVNIVKELRNVKSESSGLPVENIYYNE